MVNFIKHFKASMSRMISDSRITSRHFTLYLVLFHYWNLNRFCNPLTVRRDELMKAAKIGSRNTYARCLQDLDQWHYIAYRPRPGTTVPQKIHLLTFDTPLLTSDTAQGITCDGLLLRTDTAHAQKEDRYGITSDTLLLNNINYSNNLNGEAHESVNEKIVERKKPPHIAIPPSLDAVKTFFRDSGGATVEAEKFFYHYQANGWKVGGHAPMQNWHAAAAKWILNATTTINQHNSPSDQKTVNKKNYAEPL